MADYLLDLEGVRPDEFMSEMGKELLGLARELDDVDCPEHAIIIRVLGALAVLAARGVMPLPQEARAAAGLGPRKPLAPRKGSRQEQRGLMGKQARGERR